MFEHKHIINAIPDSLVILNEDADIVFTNESWKKFNKNNKRKSKTELIYLKTNSKATVEDKAREKQALKGIWSVINEDVARFEMEYPCHSGNAPQWFLLRVTKIKEVNTMVLLTHIDITGFKLGKEKSIQNLSDIMKVVKQEELDRNFEALSLSLCIILEKAADSLIVTNKEGVIVYANHATIALTGYSKKELEGNDFRMLKSGKHKAKFYENIWKTIHSGKVFSGIIIKKKKNDELYHEEAIITPIKNEENAITHFVYTGWDISKRIMAKNSLKQSEENLRTIYELSRNAIIIHDGRNFLDCNLATLKMYKCGTKEKFLALSLNDLHPGLLSNGQSTKEVLMKQWNKVLVRGTADFELICKRMDGTLFDSEISFVKMKLKTKTVIQVIVTDVSLQKLTKKRLIESQVKFRALASRIEKIREEERTLIARNIHDDLGHTLTALLMGLHLVIEKPECQGNDINIELKSMIELTNISIEKIKKIAANLRPGILDKLGLSAALEWQLEAFVKRNNMKTDVSIQTYTTKQLDEEKTTVIFRVFQEILTNISRHAKATFVEVVLKNDKKNIHLYVGDNGVGISDETINNINSLGLLGMAERTKIVGGEFSISSPKKGGTEINVTIPLAS